MTEMSGDLTIRELGAQDRETWLAMYRALWPDHRDDGR